MLGAIAVTAAVASLAASLYGQGRLSVEDAWQLVPPALVPAAANAVGAANPPLSFHVPARLIFYSYNFSCRAHFEPGISATDAR